ncbi:PREDICTED: sphingomyelin phosphodiesterase-like [Amphimedon queenslandica]|uniref:Sphingomyelin phosphodiesterase n=1 Tax=Amphimedon queenslandica TaxID=400682 RepID=A0AAN0JEW6_AMPQE|nr:PREDICTED: sphingomyelin phosphodiesterase-like [Amphimedon queenslandica]|eukprot:XP_019855307.1 PREDICTED: sphingomyelin phosphodiesterase-like [Amphimedon queenslandica]
MGSYAVLLSFALLFICQFQTVYLVSLRKMTLDLSRSTPEVAKSLSCDACSEMVDAVRKLAELQASESLIEEVLIVYCKKFNLADDRICKMIIPEFKDEVLYVFDHTALSTREICGTILNNKCGTIYDPLNQQWNVTIPGGKPPIKPYQPPKVNITNKILHISDIHWDPQYTPGLQAQCDEPLCCRPPIPKGESNNSAGFWGDPRQCDLPMQTLLNLIEYLNDTQDQFDWIYLTGDLPPHNIWNQTQDDQIYIFNKIINLFYEYLPNKPLFFSVGNHESAPVNSFPPASITEYSMSWLYDDAAELLQKWLTTTDAINTFKSGGFYSIDFNGLRIISLQTNYYNNQNWWLLINSTDPDGMLHWFIEKLLDAEAKGMKVHVLGHIPPGSDSWGQNYKKIVSRFENTIAGQFFGHTHNDTFTVLMDFETSSTPRPYGVWYNGPSVTTFKCQNAGYRVYTVDGNYNESSRQVLDHDTYILNITDANLTNKPKWIHEYSAKDAYNMTNLTPDSWLSLLKEFLTNNDLFLKYYHYIFKSFELDMESQYSTSICSNALNKNLTICSCLTTFSNISACSALDSDSDLNITREQMINFYATAHQHC